MLAFTDVDKQLSLPLSGRDPLGTQPVWQFRARDLVPHLTATSRRAEGFHILLVALAWWPEFAAQYKRSADDLPKFFILVEQAFARAAKTDDEEWTLPGRLRLYAQQQPGVWISLHPSLQLLGNQAANGVWGLYRGPARSAGLIDNGNRLVHADFEAGIRESTPAIRDLFAPIQAVLERPDGHVENIAKLRTKGIVGALVKIITELPLKKELRKVFLAPEQGKLKITTDLARLACKTSPDNGIRGFIDLAMNNFPHHHAVLRNVVQCEQFLAPLDALFELVCTLQGRPDDAAEEMDVDLKALKDARLEFLSCGGFEGLAKERADRLAALDFNSPARLVQSLLDLHQTVSDSRRNAPWVRVGDDGRLECRVSLDQPDAAALDPAQAWRNSYYLGSLGAMAQRLGV